MVRKMGFQLMLSFLISANIFLSRSSRQINLQGVQELVSIITLSLIHFEKQWVIPEPISYNQFEFTLE